MSEHTSILGHSSGWRFDRLASEGWAATEPQREALQELLAEHRERLVRDLQESLASKPGFREIDGPTAGEAADTVAWTYDTLGACAARLRGLTADEVRRFEAMGAERARAGMPLDAALGAFNDTFRLGFLLVAMLGTDQPDRAHTMALTEFMVGLLAARDDAVAAIRRGYGR